MGNCIYRLSGLFWLCIVSNAAIASGADGVRHHSIAYAGMSLAPKVRLFEKEAELIETTIRKGIEPENYRAVSIDLYRFKNVCRFIEALRVCVRKSESPDGKGLDACREMVDLSVDEAKTILQSGYLYIIKVLKFSAERTRCPWNKLAAKAQGCRPGCVRMQSTVNASVSFYRIDAENESERPCLPFLVIRPHFPGKGHHSIEDDEKRRKSSDRSSAENRRQSAIAEVKARISATSKAAAELAERIGSEVKQRRLFCVRTPVEAVHADGVAFRLGEEEGVSLDDTYEITERNSTGQPERIGYVKVRRVGRRGKSGKASASYAEIINSSRGLHQGDMLMAHLMFGLNFGVQFLTEFLLDRFPLSTSGNGRTLFGVIAYFDWNAAPLFGISEFYPSLTADFIRVGGVSVMGLSLMHIMLGIKKRWYMDRFVFVLGLRGGACAYIFDKKTEELFLGYGGEVHSGVEYYLLPELSLYLSVSGRYFTNPLGATNTYEPKPEAGLTGSVGIRLGI